jgi:hypothetical protein
MTSTCLAPSRCKALAANQGVCIVFCPAVPLLEYHPTASRTCPDHAEELLAWAKQNPNRFLYARPANSGPGRVFMMGLAHILQGQGSVRPDQRLGQDVGLPQGARPSTSSTIRPAPVRP